jgi:type I restriction enzyme, S subunit
MRTEKFKSLFKYAPKSNLKASNGGENGNFPFYTSSSIISKRTDKAQYYDEALVFGNGGSANVHYENEPFGTTSHCFVANPISKNINVKYVYYYLFGNIHLLERGFKGAGLKNISPKYIENLDIPVLPIETQNKIVAILDKASSLVDKRKETVNLLSILLRATFLEMFGDPTISRKYEIGNLTNYVSRIQIGPFGSQLHRSDYIEGGIPLINPINIIENKIVPDLNITISKEKYNSLPNYHLLEGDIIMARRGEMGRCGLITKKEDGFFCGTGSLFVRPNKKTDSTFLLYCLTNEGVIKYLNNSAKGITMKNLNKSILQNIPLINVPFADQNLFKNKVDAIEKTLYACLTSIAELNLLFKSILQKVFNGQLNFNVDFELDALIQEIDLQNKENDLSKITGDIAYLQRLVDKLNNQEFIEKDLYDKAKHGVFQLMAVKEEERKVIQEYDENSKSLKLALK